MAVVLATVFFPGFLPSRRPRDRRMRSGTDVTVDHDALERRLDELRGHVSDPRSGIFGPGSMAWEIDREMILLAGGGRATLLQLTHPFVAYVIEQYSVTKSDLAGRFQRTFANIHAMAFGDLESAIRSARRVWSIHSRVHGEITDDAGRFPKGSRYEALDADAIIWVWSTLVDSAVVAFELAVRTLLSSVQPGVPPWPSPFSNS